MADQPSAPARRLSPEFWAIITIGVAILGQALWLDAKIERLGDKLDAKVEVIQEGQSAIRERLAAVEVGQTAIRDRLAAVEARIGATVVDPDSEVDLAAVVEGEATR